MGKIIDGKTYKEVPINKIVINGQEIKGHTISAEDTAKGDEIRVTIFTENSDKNKAEE